MSVCARNAVAATSRRLSSVRFHTAACSTLSARHVWLNATSLYHSTSPQFNSLPHSSHPSHIPTRHCSSTPTPPSGSPLPAVHSMSELREVVEAAGPHSLVILEWNAKWCGKCKIVAAELTRLTHKYPHITVRTVDIEEGDLVEGKREAGIDHIPVLHFIKGGELVHEIVGVRTNEMGKMVEKYAGNEQSATAST